MSLYLIIKYTVIFREFSGNFPGKFFANFMNFGNFHKLFPESFFAFIIFCNAAQLYFHAVIVLTLKNHSEFSGNFLVNLRIFRNFLKIGKRTFHRKSHLTFCLLCNKVYARMTTPLQVFTLLR